MAAPSRPPTFKAYGVKPSCSGCGQKVTTQQALWFCGRTRSVYCMAPDCRRKAAHG